MTDALDPRSSRDRILAAVKALFEDGEAVSGITMTRVAKKAGVSRATIYAHFDSKRDLITSLGQAEATRPRAMLEALPSSGPVDRAALEVAALEIVESWHAQAAVASGLIELAASDDEAAEAWHAIGEAAARAVARPLRRLRPDLSRREVSDLALGLVWATERIAHQMLGRESTPAERRRVAAVIARLFWNVTQP